MHLALWNTPPAAFFASGLTSGAMRSPFTIERHDARTCTELLQRGMVDVALLPTLVALSHPDAFDVLPGAALSTWQSPYARLVLRHGLTRVGAVAYAEDDVQEALLARIILREHYSLEPAFVALAGPRLEALQARDEDAYLVTGPAAATLPSEDHALNLGQEWFELAAYPMVWGVFATRSDEATPAMVEGLLALVKAAEEQRALWVQAQDMPPDLHTFFAEDLRLRLDDLALASLNELRQYLYFYNVTEEIPDLSLFVLPDDDPISGPEPLL